MAGKPISMMLVIDTSIIVAQTKVIADVMNGFEPLLAELPKQRVKELVSKFIIELKAIIVGDQVTTFIADGTGKAVRTLSYSGDIKAFTTAFWTRELNVLH